MHIVIAHFGTYYVGMPGGVEKVTCNLANAMTEKGHKVTILYRDSKEGEPYFSLDSRIEQHNILFENGVQKISEKLPLTLRLDREIKRIFSQNAAQSVNAKYKGKQYGQSIHRWLEKLQPDVVLSCSIPSTKYVIEDAGYQGPVVTMIHADPAVQFPKLSDIEKRAAAKSAVMQLLLPSALETAQGYFPNLPMKVIGNAVFPVDRMADLQSDKPEYVISCVGNICERKNQRLLVQVFSHIMEEFPQWKLELWGRCTSRYASYLTREIHRKGWDSRILIKGETDHVENVYAHSDIFVLLSQSEGFPLSLSEAMAAGLPSVGLKKCFGVRDLIEDGKTGFLVSENEGNIAMTLGRIMSNAELRNQMGRLGKYTMKKYDPVNIWNEWESLLKQTASMLIKYNS
jgi:glycosyltransferase involved in cell wall biosynthesis